ncbi:hypothetical protein BH09BAC2_BH09BAC2_22460 [soil metagenome]
MKKIIFFLISGVFFNNSYSQITPFESSMGKKSATYFEAIHLYKLFDKASRKVMMKTMGNTDAGFPLHLVLISNDGKFDPAVWHKQNKVVILINNGIHPGEPDGIDASLQLVKDIINNKFKLPENVVVAFIPLYNIGGALNRNNFSRVNQNGPDAYGFRGNSQNLDLNRDFAKNDSRESVSFAKIFHFLDPDIFVDNHVSDGADYQHTMTLITTQYDKLGGELGEWVRNVFDPALYKSMSAKSWDMVPYVNFETADFEKGMTQFYEQPRYSSGYAALFQTIAYVPETHMLKPYADRVHSTYALMQTIIEQASAHSNVLLKTRRKQIKNIITKTGFPLNWHLDSTQFTFIPFKGYEQAFTTSEVTGLRRM